MRRGLPYLALLIGCGTASTPAPTAQPAPTTISPIPAELTACDRAAEPRFTLPRGAVVHSLAIASNLQGRIDVIVYADDTLRFVSRADTGPSTWQEGGGLGEVTALSGLGQGGGRSVAIAETRGTASCVVRIANADGTSNLSQCFTVAPPADAGTLVVLGDDGSRTFFAGQRGGHTFVYAVRSDTERTSVAFDAGVGLPVAARTGTAGAVLLVSTGTSAHELSLDFASFDAIVEQGLEPQALWPTSTPGGIAHAVPSSTTFAADVAGAPYLLAGFGMSTSPLQLAETGQVVATFQQSFQPTALIQRDGSWQLATTNVPLTSVTMLRPAHLLPSSATHVASEPSREDGWTVWAESTGDATVIRAMPSSCL